MSMSQRAFSDMTDDELRWFVRARDVATSPYSDLMAKLPEPIGYAVISNALSAAAELSRRLTLDSLPSSHCPES